ncbi:MAG: tRNA lysidine(34) synthetase TilS [Pirellulales bacterium]|nr:tRNA lysidine(34) synthetase TilS [Pirellulales bacterium]
MHAFELRLAECWPPEQWRDVTVAVAVSGGADSVALLRALCRVKSGGAGRLGAAHFNHYLREEAGGDQRFVENLCAQLEIPCVSGGVAVAETAASTGEGLEEAARRLRYAFLASAAGRLGARFVAAAHTANDQAETILHRILRGTGIGGLAGMPRARPLGPATLIRPMLTLRRDEVLAYLHDVNQTYREDASNADCRFTRNRLRRELLPLLAREFNPRVEEVLLRLGSLAGEVQQVVAGLVDALMERAVICPSAEQAILDRRELHAQPRHVLRELLIRVWRRQGWPLQAMGGAQWEQLAEMLLGQKRGHSAFLEKPECPLFWRRTFPGAILAEVAEDALQLIRLPQ